MPSSVVWLLFLSLCLSLTVASSAQGIMHEDIKNVKEDSCPALSDGYQSDSSSCPFNYCFRANPVCGVDNVTYWCGCKQAACAGVRVSKKGYCEFNEANSSVSGQALLLVHIVWLFVLGFAVLFGFL